MIILTVFFLCILIAVVILMAFEICSVTITGRWMKELIDGLGSAPTRTAGVLA